MNAEQRYLRIRRVTVIGGVVDLVLGLVKILVGFFANSQALVADGIHSLSDLGTDVAVILAAREAQRSADDEHPYGYARVETAVTVMLGITLLAVAVGIAWDAAERMFHPQTLLTLGTLAFSVALISALSKEAIYHYTMRTARELGSRMLSANAWHHRSDAMSSIVVMVGVAGTMAGLQYLDAVAALIVAVMIARIGVILCWSNILELIDTGLDTTQLESMREVILGVGGVCALHQLRTRRMGANVLVDVHIQVDPKLSVSEGHRIGDMVYERLLEDKIDVSDLTVHIDPEDDDINEDLYRSLPDRGTVMATIEERCHGFPGHDQIGDVILHYIGGKIHVEIRIPLDVVASPREAEVLVARYRKALAEDPHIARVDVLFAPNA